MRHPATLKTMPIPANYDDDDDDTRESVGFGISSRSVDNFVMVVFISFWSSIKHCSFVAPSELAFSATLKETLVSFGFRFSPPPPPRVMGSSIITDPRDEPLLPDQSSFSARRRSVAILGDTIRNPVWVFSAFQPGNINGKVTSNVGQRIAL